MEGHLLKFVVWIFDRLLLFHKGGNISHFVKAISHKFYMVHSLCFCLEFLWNCRGDDLKISVCQFIVHNAQKMKFSVKDFSSGNCEFVHIYWRNAQWKTIFCVVVEVKNSLTSRIEWGWFFTKIFLNNLSLLVYEFSKFIFD